MRLLYSWQASLSAQTQCREKTVDTHKMQFPLHHIKAHHIFLKSNVKFSWAISHSTQCAVMVCCPNRRSVSHHFEVQKMLQRWRKNCSQSVQQLRWSWIPHFLIANGGHTWCLTQTLPYQMLYLILKYHLHTASENWLWFSTKHMKQDYTGALFKGTRLTFSCLRCKLQINFLCWTEHTGLAWFPRQCTWASSFCGPCGIRHCKV